MDLAVARRTGLQFKIRPNHRQSPAWLDLLERKDLFGTTATRSAGRAKLLDEEGVSPPASPSGAKSRPSIAYPIAKHLDEGNVRLSSFSSGRRLGGSTCRPSIYTPGRRGPENLETRPSPGGDRLMSNIGRPRAGPSCSVIESLAGAPGPNAGCQTWRAASGKGRCAEFSANSSLNSKLADDYDVRRVVPFSHHPAKGPGRPPRRAKSPLPFGWDGDRPPHAQALTAVFACRVRLRHECCGNRRLPSRLLVRRRVAFVRRTENVQASPVSWVSRSRGWSLCCACTIHPEQKKKKKKKKNLEDTGLGAPAAAPTTSHTLLGAPNAPVHKTDVNIRAAVAGGRVGITSGTAGEEPSSGPYLIPPTGAYVTQRSRVVAGPLLDGWPTI